MAAIVILQDEENRRALRRERVFRDRTNTIAVFNDLELISRYRFPRQSIENIVNLAVNDISRPTARTHAIPAIIQVLVTLRYLAKGDFLSQVGDIHGISKSSVSRIIHTVCAAINRNLRNIKFPEDQPTVRKMKTDFYGIAGFPNCVGAIDGTLIPISGMTGPQEPAYKLYICRKNFHALNIQAVCDANMRFLNINTRFPGAMHDAYILNTSSLPNVLSQLPDGGWLLGDSRYPLKDWLMTPFQNPSTPAETNYNVLHAKTRTIIERSFGILKIRFRCLQEVVSRLNQ